MVRYSVKLWEMHKTITSTGRTCFPVASWLSGDIAGAFCDLGTFLPLIIGVLIAGQIAATPSSTGSALR